MIKKILFLVNFPFSQRDFERYGIELLMENGFEVEIWDITDILHPDVRKNYVLHNPIDWQYYRIFSDKKEILNEIRSLSSETFIFANIHYTRERYPIYKAISRSNAKYAINLVNSLPYGDDKKHCFLFYLKKLQKVTVKELLNYGFFHLPFTWLGIKPASLMLVGGEQSLKYRYLVGKTTEIVWAHTLDYDLYFKERKKPFIERPIAVFLDDYLPFHHIRFYRTEKFSISADKYYFLLNKLFNLVENQLGLEVVIAAHPGSHYEKHPDYFQGRKLVRGQTIKLVRESQLVLNHNSTALNFAILFNKPVIFLTFSDLERCPESPYIRAMAKWLGKEPIFMDTIMDIDWEFEFIVNKVQYDNYRQAYIKTENSEDLPFWQIVANRLKLQ